MKLNVDAALFKDQSCSGFGTVVRYSEGRVIVAVAGKVDYLLDPLVAEASTLWEGLRLMQRAGLQPHVVESDSKMVVDAVNDGLPLPAIGSLVYDIKSLLVELNDGTCCFIPRSEKCSGPHISSRVYCFLFECVLVS